MSVDYGQILVQKMAEAKVITSPKGCTEAEIQTVMEAQSVKRLPEVYRQFLLKMGHGPVFFFGDFYYRCQDLLKLKHYALGLLNEIKDYRSTDKNIFKLPEDSFVFEFYGGYEFKYFRTENTGDNPPVYGFFEEKPNEPSQYWESIMDFFDGEIAQFVLAREKSRASGKLRD